MKRLSMLFLPIMLYSQSFIISNVPLPKTYVQNLDPYECNEICMKRYMDKGQVFSFLANANQSLIDIDLEAQRIKNISLFNLDFRIQKDTLKIAMLLPYKKIGKYVSTTTNAVFAYLITKEYPFELKSYKIDGEDIDSISNALKNIKNDGFEYVIAPVTQEGAKSIISTEPTLSIYFPTINKNDVNTTLPNLIYGGIDYQKQSDELLKQAVSPLVIFYDKSSTGKRLSLYEESKFIQNDIDEEYTDEFVVPPKKVIKYSIARRTTNLERYLKNNHKITNGSFFLNTPIVKSGMIMSQLTLYDVNTTNLLSTQINYDPLILSMTQYTDRKNMIIANSITKYNNIITETNALLGNDIVYDWINYTTTVGIDYIFHLVTKESREYDINISPNNQMQYDIELLKPKRSNFTHL